jgi:hypothetical protein
MQQELRQRVKLSIVWKHNYLVAEGMCVEEIKRVM